MTFGFPELAAIRLGYGLSPLMPPPADAAAVLASVAHAGPGPEAMTTAEASRLALELRSMGEAAKTAPEPVVEEYRAFGRKLSRMMLTDLQRRIARAVDAPVGFGERLVQFWADHFTARPLGAAYQPLGLAYVDEAIRPYVNGRFEDMFFAADTHPMMLVYLNQTSSRGPNSIAAKRNRNKALGLNENLAREAMELLFETALKYEERGLTRDFTTGNNDADGPFFLQWVQRRFPDRAAHIEAKLRQWGGNSSGVNVANIDNLGNVHPDTMWWHHTLGNVRERSFGDIWTDLSDPLMAGLKQSPRPVKGRCAECRYLAICNGNTRVRAQQLTGDPWQEDPGCYLDNAEIGVAEGGRLEVKPWVRLQPAA